jgi:hypothetical protein
MQTTKGNANSKRARDCRGRKKKKKVLHRDEVGHLQGELVAGVVSFDLNDEGVREAVLEVIVEGLKLNRGEARPALAASVFHMILLAGWRRVLQTY